MGRRARRAPSAAHRSPAPTLFNIAAIHLLLRPSLSERSQQNHQSQLACQVTSIRDFRRLRSAAGS
eukprot:1016324-Pleurochrysis_carterae.AAC.1